MRQELISCSVAPDHAMVARTLSLFLLIAGLHSSSAYKHYQYDIPNGDRVGHPCFPNKLWWGVGHYNQAGGGARNQFGKDFAANGHKWTEELCRMDSDQDGMTNGQELGDPDCIWEKDDVPERTFNITHPGVCDPYTSEKCKKINGNWNLCVSDEFKCPAIEEPGVFNYTVQYTRTLVPAKVTNYYCQAFDLPTNGTYHMIATQAQIDNANMMHHILVFGCDKRPRDKMFEKPQPCGMGGSQCRDIISIWTLGSRGDCLPEPAGIPIGKKGYKHVVLQYHWNNPMMLSDQYDATAMTFFLTSNKRPYDGGVFTAGQRYLEIPPVKQSVIQEGNCSSGCTKRKLQQPIYFTNILAHMHYAGRMAELLQYRNGTLIREILPKTEIRYDEPQKFPITPPAEFLPGDQLVTRCDFRSTGIPNTVYYGESTQDEMCYMFLNYYPKQDFKYCVEYGPVDPCMIDSIENGGDGKGHMGRIDDCHVGNFLNGTIKTKWMPRVEEYCDLSIDACQPECMEVYKELIENEPCWKGWPKKYLEFLSTVINLFDVVKQLRLSIAPCELELAVQEALNRPDPPDETTDESGGASEGGGSSSSTIIFIVGGVAIAALFVSISVFGILRAMNQRPSFQKDEEDNNDAECTIQSFDNKIFEDNNHL